MNKYFYESETRRIAALNEIFGEVELTAAEMRTLVWLAGWDEYTIENVLSAIRKALGRAQRQLLMDGTAVKSAFALLSLKVTKAMRRIRR